MRQAVDRAVYLAVDEALREHASLAIYLNVYWVVDRAMSWIMRQRVNQAIYDDAVGHRDTNSEQGSLARGVPWNFYLIE